MASIPTSPANVTISIEMLPRTVHRLGVVIMLGLGVLLWLGVVAIGHQSVALRLGRPLQLQAMGLAVVAVLIGPVRRRVFAGMQAVRHPAPRRQAAIAVGIALAAMAYLLATAIYQKRDWFPKFQDESMHLVQMQLLAQGRLWLPAHPMADFFETFHIFVKPVYAPMHFPGTSLLYVPLIWLHLPYWLGPLLVAGACVGSVYRLFTELIDGVAGVLGAILMLGLQQFRFVSLMVLSNPVALLLGLLMVWAYLRWRCNRGARWAAVLGAIAGLAAITRPPDAICFALPLGLAMLWDLAAWATVVRGLSRWVRGFRAINPLCSHEQPLKRTGMTGLALLAGAVPFLVLQLAFNRGVSGSLLQSPHDRYSRLFNPGVNYGLREPDLTARPATALAQKKKYYAWFVAPYIFMHRPSNLGRVLLYLWLPTAAKTMLPATGFLVLLPAGLMGLARRKRWVLAAVLPLGFTLYALSVMIGSYYLLFAAPAALMLVLLGARQIETAWPRARAMVSPAMALLVLAFTLATLPEVRGEAPDQFPMPTIKAVEEQLSTIGGRALVLFTYRDGDNYHEEPVYNTSTADLDDARIIRAHDLGVRNVELFRYYAGFQPDRVVYRFDRRSRTMERWGTVVSQ